ncbi:hypothetical protein [Desulforhopalus singaporensis]|uniref:hypothetical protein n=1 Tax=Desulforhopalus singaporensis TaxID=91360 RepID=UPI001FE105C8|nr:hypothetical protein [Desulforhopalus singaporensis]
MKDSHVAKQLEEKQLNHAKQQDQPMGRVSHRPYWVLNLSIVIRAIHQLGVAVYLASFLLPEVVQPPRGYIVLAFGSGVVLVLTEWLRHRQLYRELSGVVVVIKLLLLGGAVHGFLPVVPTVVAAFFISSIGAHAPKLVRHRLIF